MELDHKPDGPLKRMPRKERPEFLERVILWLAMMSGSMLFLGLIDLLGAKSILGYFKCGLVAVAASAVAFGINRLAIDRGTRQAAAGTPGATALSLVSMGIVSAGMFAATFAGFTLSEVEALQLEEFGGAQAAFIGAKQEAALKAAKVIPGVRSIVTDLAAKETCERTSGCVSGKGGAEDGPFSRALGSQRQRAEAMLASLERGVELRVAAFNEMNRLQTAFHTMVSDDTLSVAELRARANDLAMHISQTVNMLVETDPVSFVSGFAEELATPTGANQKIDELRSMYAQQLRTMVSSVDTVRHDTPVLPSKAGVSNTFSYIGQFLPLALIVLAVEAVLPFALWLYTYFGYLARLEEDDPVQPSPQPIRRNGNDPSRVSR